MPNEITPEEKQQKVQAFQTELNQLCEKYDFRLEPILSYNKTGVEPTLNIITDYSKKAKPTPQPEPTPTPEPVAEVQQPEPAVAETSETATPQDANPEPVTPTPVEGEAAQDLPMEEAVPVDGSTPA